MGQGKTAWNSLRDYLVLSLILAGMNLLLNRADIGWLSLNPSPWLLPGVLVGARYGFGPGLLAGIATSALLAFANSQMTHSPLMEALHEHAFFYVAFVIAAAVAGEAGTLTAGSFAALKRNNARLVDDNSRLRGQLEIVLETRQQLQRELAVFNAPLCALDEELRTLFSYSQDEFGDQLLRILHRLTGLTSAAIYVVERNRLERTAVIHPTPQLQEKLLLSETPLAEKAVTMHELASVPDASQLNSQQPFLAAFPWMDHLGRTSVLLIHDMPLHDFTMENLARLELILSWASAMAVLRQTFTGSASSDHTVPADDFLVLLGEALAADRIHGLPSAVLRFKGAGSDEIQDALHMLPLTAVATRMDAENAFAVLLPFSGETEANDLTHQLAAAIPSLRAHHYLITGTITPEALWAHLTKS